MEPRHAIVTGTGEIVEPIELPAVHVVLVPDARGLSAGEVYAELDRREGWRERLDPAPLRQLAGAGAGHPRGRARERPGARRDRAAARRRRRAGGPEAAGALGAGVSGSGPTCFGLFESGDAAERAAKAIPGAIATRLRAA